MALENYKHHPSISTITELMNNLGNFPFSFNFISYNDTVKEVNKS